MVSYGKFSIFTKHVRYRSWQSVEWSVPIRCVCRPVHVAVAVWGLFWTCTNFKVCCERASVTDAFSIL